MKALVFGRSGQVASELANRVPTSVEFICLDRDGADLSDPSACGAAIRDIKPDVVINAAAYTAVDRAEDEEELATRVNGEAPGVMAQACADLGIPVLHVSTDYVFDGSGHQPWNTTDVTAPLNAYGRSKLAGETAIKATGAAHVILRTSWVVSAHGSNFVKTMLRLADSRDELSIVSDQIGGPTPAADIAQALWTCAAAIVANPSLSGVYHFSGAPDVSWADFAREIFAQGDHSVRVKDIPTAEFPTPAKRPANSRLACDATTAAFGVARPDWRVGLRDILSALEGKVT